MRVSPFAFSVLLLLPTVACTADAADPSGIEPDAGVESEPDGPPPPATVCGNGIVEDGEACDGADLDGTTCQSLGYPGGELHCRLDCQSVRTGGCLVPYSSGTWGASDLGLAIPDDAYDGSLTSMACTDVVVPEPAMFVDINRVRFRIAVTHPWVGDLVVKVRAPSGHLRTLMHRPGRIDLADDGAAAGGEDADLDAAYPITFSTSGFNAEQLGSTLDGTGAACRDDDRCNYFAEPGPTINTFGNERMSGTWTICVGDAGPGDVGTLQAASVYFEFGAASPGPFATAVTMATPIGDGTYDGTVASMTCAPVTLAATADIDASEELSAQFAVTHPRSSQLVFALVDPAGKAHGMASRPTVVEDASGSPNLNGGYAVIAAEPVVKLEVGTLEALTSAETMGLGSGTVCDPATACRFAADRGGSSFAPPRELIGQPISGTWSLCVGDAVPGITGTFDSAILRIVPSARP